MSSLLKHLFFLLVVRPLVLVVVGLNVRRRELLPSDGPAIIVANHNSHLDTLVLMSALPWHLLTRARPVAAADYFLANQLIAWFSQRVIGIVPIDRSGTHHGADPLASLSAALDRGDVLLVFPEGTRGEPEQLAELKSGVARLAVRHPEVPVVPVFVHGLGKTLPKGAWIPVPVFCDVFVGASLNGRLIGTGEPRTFMAALQSSFAELASEHQFPRWE